MKSYVNKQVSQWGEKGQGQKLWKKITPKLNRELQELHQLKAQDLWNPTFHLSAYSGLINDPVGLVKHQNWFHIFYQWSPFFPVHGLKHWGHFKTLDFINFEHTGVAIIPSLKEERDGAYSGGAYSDDQKMQIFWTGNIKYSLPNLNKEKARTAFTLTSEWNDRKNCLKNKNVLFEVNKKQYSGHFRDPFPIKIANNYFLLHAAQKKNGFGTLSLYKSKYLAKDYTFFKNIKFNFDFPRNIRMIECPCYFKLNNQDILAFTIQRFADSVNHQTENQDRSIALIGKMNWVTGEFNSDGKIWPLDYGFDFYAQQVFNNSKPIIIGWAANQGHEQIETYSHMWAHMLTLPRKIKLVNNKLTFWPINALKNLRHQNINLNNQNLRPCELILDEEDFEIILASKENKIIIKKTNKLLLINKEDDQNTISQANKLRKVDVDDKVKTQIFFDNSIFEIFINGKVITSKFFLKAPKIIIKKGKVIDWFSLKALNINWGLNG